MLESSLEPHFSTYRERIFFYFKDQARRFIRLSLPDFMEIPWNLCEFILLSASPRLPSLGDPGGQTAIKKLKFNDYIES